MKSKEIYTLVGLLAVIGAVAWWGSASRGTEQAAEEPKQAEAAPAQAKKPSASVPNTPSTSVNPSVPAAKPTPTMVTAQSLNGSVFRLATYNGEPVPADTKFTLTFTNTDFAWKLCNTLSSSYYIDQTNFKANNVVTTQMYCTSPAGIMNMESDASLLLNSGGTTIYRSGSTLILSNPKGIVFAFEGF